MLRDAFSPLVKDFTVVCKTVHSEPDTPVGSLPVGSGLPSSDAQCQVFCGPTGLHVRPHSEALHQVVGKPCVHRDLVLRRG